MDMMMMMMKNTPVRNDSFQMPPSERPLHVVLSAQAGYPPPSPHMSQIAEMHVFRRLGDL